MKSKLTDEDIPDLADMLGKKLFKVILGLHHLTRRPCCLSKQGQFFFFWHNFHDKIVQFSAEGNVCSCQANIAAVTYTANKQFFFFFLFLPLSVSVQEVGVTKPTLFDLLPFKLAQMTVRFVKSLPEQYQVLLEYWEERRKEKIEEEKTEEEDETDGN